MMMEQYAKIIKDNEQMENENKSYLKLQELNKIKKENQDLLNDAKRELFDDIKQKLNSKMKEINNSLYTEKHTAPEIEFGDTNYSFKTPDDTGTGSAYKGLVVFDLAILRLTDLPILVHDSLILISISDEAVQNILQQYIDCGKQVIIALDKQDSYSDKTASILKKYAVIELAPNEQALFGRSWNKQKFQAA
ncbi:MAG: DUF2326 domain-containing protein [Neisseriaceae bacterium]|nr:DUF2326 domain-containing protein [Neisseriaceae bacterium]